MRRALLVIGFVAMVMAGMAQAPLQFHYQAVVRNDSNRIVRNTTVGVRTSILSEAHDVIYSEFRTAMTDGNGLLTLEVGSGEVETGIFNDIPWDDGKFFLQTEIDPEGGHDYTITLIDQLMSVPYAIYANHVANDFSGDYNDLDNLPTLFNGEWDSLRHKPNFAVVATTGSYNDLTGTPNLHAVATSGNYNDLENKPDLFSGDYNDLQNKPALHDVATSGNYNVLENKPTIPTVPSNVSSFNNDVGYLTNAQFTNLVNTVNQHLDSLAAAVQSSANCCAIPAGDAQPCPGTPTVTDIDNITYNTVKIGNQCWMKENLRVTHYADGTDIALGTSASSDIPYRYNPNNSAANVSTYGYLYNWAAVMYGASSSTLSPSGVQGPCPTGWHIPSDDEWTELTDYVAQYPIYRCVGNAADIAKSLASTTGWNSYTGSCVIGDNPSKNNHTGFSAMPAGYYDGSFNGFGQYANFWSTSENNTYAWYRYLDYNLSVVTRNSMSKSRGKSIRCVLGQGYNLAKLITTEASNINYTAATSGGNISHDGGASVTARGVCWSTSPNPTLSDSHTSDGTGMGGFTSTMNALSPNTTYYVRAYATNSMGTRYGEQQIFTTLEQTPPTVTTNNISGISYNSATCGGNVTADGGATVTARGVCWSTSPNPTLDNNPNYTTNGTGTGSFTSSLLGLTPNTTYYVRAYATNSKGTAYGEQQSFKTYCNTVIINITGNTTINYGGNTTLKASGANNYVWKTGNTTVGNTATITVSPTATTTYTVTGTNQYGCSGTKSTTVTVNPIRPTVTTNEITDINTTTATSGGNVTSNGGDNVTARGICWSTSQNPTVSGNHTSEGTGTGEFTSTMTGLTPNTTYYVRAYATNSVGPNYGEQKTFTTTCNTVTITITGDTAINYGGSTTLTASGANNYVWKRNNTTVSTTANLTVNPTSTTTYSVTGTNQYGCTGTASVTVIVNAIMPTVTTSNVSNITATTATSGGNVTSAGGAAITARGICWSTNQSPTVDDAHTTNGTGTGTFTSTMNELTPNTTYYVRAYATNSAGTNYGDQKTLTTLCNTVNVTIAGNTTINYGDITTLTASGADNYVWKRNNTTVSTTADLSVNPTSTTTYSVTGTNQYGCTGTASVTVTVNAILPTVTTNNVSDIAATTATSGGNVTSDGGAAISARGICWSTNQNPTVDGAHTTNGTGTGTFTSAMNELTPNTTYYVRAYATNSAGTAYGEQKAFTTACNTVNVTIAGNTTISYGESTTLTASGANRYVWNDGNSEISTNASVTVNPTATTTYTVTGTNQYGCTGTASFTVTVNAILPTVTTNNVSDITTTTATSGGNITSDGGAAITARGICWSTNQNPTVDGAHTTNGTGTGTFTSAMNELTPNTTYYVRAYATNSAGTAYGEQKTFKTECNTVNVTIAGITTINYGESTTLTASGADNYVWSDGNSDIGTNNSVTVSPTATTTYTVTGTNQYGCTGTASFTITVNAILPTVTTNNVSNIADTTATSGGNVTSDGGAAITARGICWSTSQNPTVSDNHTTNGTGTGTYTSAMSELTPNTTYYVRAYATNSAGTAYGEQKAFTTECNTVTVSITGITTIDYGGSTTLTASGANSYDWSDGNSNISTNASVTVNPTSTTTYSVTGTNQYGCTGTKSTIVTVNAILPTVTTDNVSDVAATTATSGGNITSDGGAAITARGVCWSTSQNPTVSGSHTSDGTGTGTFSSEMTGLTPNTTYYVRAYATNSAGTEYGEQKTFKTECNTVTVSITGTTNISHGGSTTLTASGANSYEWKRGNTTIGTNASVTVNPTSTTTYTVIGTNLYGCKGTATVDVVVNALLPAITTYNVSNIGTTAAASGGNITSDGGSAVTARGVCWSTSQNPTVSDSHTSDGTGTGTFTSSITYLTPNTTYYVRAYATNSAGTAYGEQRTFTTECNTVTISITGNTTISYGGSTMLTSSGADSYVWKTGNTTVGNTATITVSPTATTTYTVTGTNQYGCTGTANVTVIVNAILPTVTTNNVSNIADATATSGGNISSDGGANVTARGICWSTSQNPTVSDNHTTNGTGSGTFTSSMTDLTPNTTYYVRAYATNSAGTAYGEQKTFTTLCNTVNVTIAGNTTISYGGSTTLTASGANNYVWSDGNSNIGTNASITVSPTATAVYFVTGTNQYGCTGTTSVTVTVNALLPTVTTNVVSNITYLTAEAGGNVTGDGGSTVTSRGICWSTSQNPTVSDDHTTNGSGTGSFTSAMTGLTPNTTYYVRAYATNSAGTAYGEQRTFTTECNTVTISITGNTTISYGGSTMLTASEADSYVWKTGNTTIGSTASITVNPTATTTYSVTGTNQYGCASSASVTVTVNAIPPTVSTSNVNNISTTTATCGGNVTSNGGAAVTARGICWSTSENPTMDGNHTTDGTGTGSFTSSITGLSPNTTYYVRAYATNSAGTAYGEQKTFKTVEEIIPTDIHIEGEELYCVGDDIILTAVSDKPGTFTWITWVGDRVGQTIHIPADQTLSSFPVSVTITTATGNTLTSDDKLITVNAAPTVYDYVFEYANGRSFTDPMICAGEAFGISAVVTSGSNYSYNYYMNGSQVSDPSNIVITGTGDYHFTFVARDLSNGCRREDNKTIEVVNCVPLNDALPCPGLENVTDCDNNVYNTVKLGDQCWMKENLRVTHYVDGKGIPVGNSNSYDVAYRYTPNNNANTVATYGYLYNWKAVMRGAEYNNLYVQGICPNGWHVPTDAEWIQLINYVGSVPAYVCGDNNGYIAKALAASTGWNNINYGGCTVVDNQSQNNATGFNGTPAGRFDVWSADFGNLADYWTSTENSSIGAYARYLYYNNAHVGEGVYNKDQAKSVRCILGQGYNLSSVTTNNVSNIAATSAVCGGNITSDGGKSVTARGVCWSTSHNPTTTDAHTSNGSGAGSFASTITGLTPNTTYYVRAYATNDMGTSYGDELEFTTTCNTFTITISGNNYIPVGGSTTLTASGADSYLWSTGQITSTITVTPAGNTTYTVTGTNIFGCTSTESVTVHPLTGDIVTLDGETRACYYGPTTSNIIVTAWVNGTVPTDGTLTWYVNGVSTPNVAGYGSHFIGTYAPSANPYQIHVVYTNVHGISATSDPISVRVFNRPQVTVTGDETHLCDPGNVTLTATLTNPNSYGEYHYQWYRNSVNNSGMINSATSQVVTLPVTESTDFILRTYVSTNSDPNSLQDCDTYDTIHVEVGGCPPAVTTNDVSNIASNSATCGGNVTSDGGATVTARGICWSTSQNPTVSGSHTTDGTGKGTFTSSLTSLTPNTTYYVRAYATSNVGTGYGEEKTFTTLCNTFSISISGNTSIYSGQSTTLTASGANSYEWKSGNTTISTSAAVSVSPTSNTTYTVTGTNGYGCTATASVTVTVSAVSAPTVTTNTVSNVTYNSASCGGNVTNGGGSTVTARGVCWGTSQNPTINGSHTTDGSGTGSFTSSITGLTPHTTYYVRAYATNSAGTAYGTQRTFTTLCQTFAVTISGNTSINSGESTTLTASGAYSYVWKSGSTTVGNTATVTLTPASTTTYSVTGTDVYGCTAMTSVTVTVINNDGQPCPGQATVTDYDGNVYNTVLVGNQCWMKENLRTTHYANGTSVSYNNYSASNIPLEKRGYLYNWTAAMNGASSSNTTPSGVQGICPTGWHLPSIGEWIQLRNYVNSQNGYLCNSNTANNAKALAYTNYWNISSTVCHVGNNMEQNNTTGLSIVPAGIYNGQSFSNAGSIAYLQSSSSYGNTQQSYDLQILHNEFSVQTNSHTNRSYGQSVRCIRNN